MGKEPLALVLSGGSVRAAAQVGVIQALEEYNLRPNLVVGTSGGSIVAALYATGMNSQQLTELFTSFSGQKKGLVDFNWLNIIIGLILRDRSRLSGLIKGRVLQGIVHNNLLKAKEFTGLGELAKKDDSIRQLMISAVNLSDGQETIFCDLDSLGLPLLDGEYKGFRLCNHVSIAQAVRASISIPGVFVPARFSNNTLCECYRSKLKGLGSIDTYEYYVDGGIRNGYPFNAAVKLGKATKVIGVNLGYAGMRREDIIAKGPVEILSQSLDIMMLDQILGDLMDQDVQKANIVTINPLIYDISTFEVEYIPQMIERGYQVATRLFQQKGLARGGDSNSNGRLLFANVRRSMDFPQKGTPYFKELVKNQIKTLEDLEQNREGDLVEEKIAR